MSNPSAAHDEFWFHPIPELDDMTTLGGIALAWTETELGVDDLARLQGRRCLDQFEEIITIDIGA